MPPQRLKRALILLLKLAVSLGLVTYLVVEIQRGDPQSFARLATGSKDWPVLIAAWSCLLAGLALGVLRWRLLVRALEVPCALPDAFRWSVLAYLLDFTAAGTVGGDLLKAILLARRQPGHGTAALASVVADRGVGLYVLCLVTCGVILWSGIGTLDPEVRLVARAALLLTAAGSVAAVALLVAARPGRSFGFLDRWPRLGEWSRGALTAARAYRRRPAALAGAAALSAAVVCLNVGGFYLIARSFPGNVPTLREQFLIVPVALVSSVVPLPLQTLGVLDYALSTLYASLSYGRVSGSLGLLVAMAYRLLGVGVALAGAGFCLGSRGELRAAVSDVSSAPDRQQVPGRSSGTR